MSLYKHIVHTPPIRAVLCWLGATYIRFVYATSRWETRNAETVNAMWDAGDPFIIAFWHGRLFMMPHVWRKDVPIRLMISHHRDGELLARTIHHFGFDTIRGSTSQGGGGALRDVLRSLKSGKSIGITPDGPRGPRMQASGGIISVAMLGDVPIVPSTYAISRRKVLASWDRFTFPFPFSRGIFIWGDAISVSRDADDQTTEAARQTLERTLNEITATADRFCDVDVIKPDQATSTGHGSGAEGQSSGRSRAEV